MEPVKQLLVYALRSDGQVMPIEARSIERALRRRLDTLAAGIIRVTEISSGVYLGPGTASPQIFQISVAAKSGVVALVPTNHKGVPTWIVVGMYGKYLSEREAVDFLADFLRREIQHDNISFVWGVSA